MSIRFFVSVLILTAVANCYAEVIDGIAATVNGQVILKSDLDEDLRCEAFMAGKPASRSSALDRLIDQELLRQQIHTAVQATSKQIDSQINDSQIIDYHIKEIWKLHHAATEREWTSLLHDAGLTEKELRRYIGWQIQLTRLVDERLRPSTNISSENIDDYYRGQLLPRLRQSAGTEVPLADVSAKIKELLVQRRINELLAAWLQNLHGKSDIRTESHTSVASGQSP